jgi:hypothetical protein
VTNKEHEMAAIAYDAYCHAVGMKTHDGQDVPSYEKLAKKTQRGWYESYLASAQSALYEAVGVVGDDYRKSVDTRRNV